MKYVKIAKVDAVGPEEYAFMVSEVADESFDQFIADGYSEATYGEFYATQSDEVKANLPAPEVALPHEVEGFVPEVEAGPGVPAEVVPEA